MKFAMFSLMQWPEDRSETAVFDNEIEQAVVAEAQGYDAVFTNLADSTALKTVRGGR